MLLLVNPVCNRGNLADVFSWATAFRLLGTIYNSQSLNNWALLIPN